MFLRAKFIWVLVCLLVIAFGCQENNEPNPTPGQTSFARVVGSKILDPQGQELQLKGVAFGNEIWGDQISRVHHDERDYARMKAMKMNVIRFYLNYRFFEDDAAPGSYKQSGWDWLDQNIAWAKKYDIQLILNMHAPQGGYQSQGKGDALWTNPANQDRLANLWKAIAQRYADEPTILGYGPVNEPYPTESISQWSQLAQKLINAIRQVDPNHILFIERALQVKNEAGRDPSGLNFPEVSGSNLVYEFHFYDPFYYTHQLFDWASTGDGGKYPDPDKLMWTDWQWYTATFGNPKLPPGNTDWKYYEGVKYHVTDPKIKVGMMALVGQNVGGKVYFDNLTLKEFGPSGQFIREIYQLNLNDLSGWGFWSKNGSGKGSVSENVGWEDQRSLQISGTSDDANLTNYSRAFAPKPDHYYQISGYMKGENIAQNANALLRIDFQTTDGPLVSLGKESLRNALKPTLDWAKKKNVPLYLGEFGAGVHCFENDKGGLQWVEDMLDICAENKLHWTYHAYHEYSFGIFRDGSSLPDESKANLPLIELFKRKN
ncbi:glycoside hydrolase family 5 protein [Algoriphagus namhaensis]